MSLSDPDKDPREWFEHAHSFFEGSKKLSYFLYDAPKEGKEPKLFEAYGVLIALAVEAFIKCLYVIQLGKRPSGHDLSKLFKSLPREDKKEIHVHYDLIAKESDLLGRMRLYHPHLPLDLDSVLIRTQNAFVKYRYPSQDASAVYGLYEIAAALEKHIGAVWAQKDRP